MSEYKTLSEILIAIEAGRSLLDAFYDDLKLTNPELYAKLMQDLHNEKSKY